MLHLHEPLEAQTRLDRHVRTLGVTDFVVVVLDLLHETRSLQVFHNLLAAVETIHAVVLTYVSLEFGFYRVHVQMGIRREDVDGFQIIFLTKGVVVHIVCRGHFEATGTETDLYVTVFDDRDHTTHTRYDHVLAFEPLVFLLFGVDADCYIAKDGLRTRRSDDGVFARLFRYFVTQVVELIMLIVVDHLLVTQRCLTLGIPVDHTQTAVDKTFLIEVAEHFDDRFRTGLVHGERRAVPVAGTTEFAELLQDDASVFVRPRPRVFEKLLAGQVTLIDTLLLEAFDHFRFRCDRRMVGTRYPARVLALETCATNEDVLNRLVQHVSHVQHTGHIGWRNNDSKRIAAVRLAMKEFVVEPILIPAGFDVCRIVLCFHIF